MRKYECTYCGQVKEVTDDHIPPKSIYKDPMPSCLPTVKSCAECNQGSSEDDEYFRDTVLKYHAVSGKPQAKKQLAAMYRAATIPQKRKYTDRTISAFIKTDVMSSGGIYLGTVPAYRIERQRLESAVERYVRGLYRYDTKLRLPDDRHIKVIINPEVLYRWRQQIEDLLAGARSKTIQEGVFWYSWQPLEDKPETSFWLLVFYDSFPIIAVIDKDERSAA